MEDFFGAIGDTITGWLDGFLQTIYDFFWSIFYYIAYGICKLVGIFSDMADIFAGLTKVNYDGDHNYLVNIFFTHKSVSNVYWAIALMGMILCIAFAIIAVIKKTFDIGDKVKQSLGGILTATFKGIIMISLTTAMMLGVFGICGTIMEQLDYAFNNADVLDLPAGNVTFTDEQYATMARILNTVGNYSMNPTYNSRYNINTCFNAIRKDMKKLEEQDMFRLHYQTKDPTGRTVETWQSALQKIANAASLSKDMNLDQYNESLSNAMLWLMELLRNDASFKPLDYYKVNSVASDKITIDRIVFLMGTLNAAKNPEYNVNPGISDPLRGPYYTGEKDVYSLSQFKQDFDIGTSMNYLIIYVAGVKLLMDLAVIIFNCIASIFNVLILYLISPLVFATVPLDDGAKVKQWSIAYIVQSLGIFANIFAMRLMLMLIPIIMGGKLTLVESNSFLDFMAKIVLVVGLFAATKKTTGMITGILTDQAGFQSVQAGDMSDMAKGAGAAAWTATKTGASLGWGVTKGTASLGWGGIKGVGSLAKGAYNGIKNKFSGGGASKIKAISESASAGASGGGSSGSSGGSSEGGSESSPFKEGSGASSEASGKGSSNTKNANLNKNPLNQKTKEKSEASGKGNSNTENTDVNKNPSNQNVEKKSEASGKDDQFEKLFGMSKNDAREMANKARSRNGSTDNSNTKNNNANKNPSNQNVGKKSESSEKGNSNTENTDENKNPSNQNVGKKSEASGKDDQLEKLFGISKEEAEKFKTNKSGGSNVQGSNPSNQNIGKSSEAADTEAEVPIKNPPPGR